MNNSKDFLKAAGIRIEEDGKLVSDENPGSQREIEDYIVLSLKGKTYYIYEVHRADRILRKEEQQEDKAVIWAAILYKRMNDDPSDRVTARKIRTVIRAGDEASAEEMFREFDSSIYSIGEEKEGALCLIRNKKNANVIYNGKTIVEEASLSRAYVVLYNYCRSLREIQEFYRVHRRIMEEAGITQQDAAELYMGI